MSSFGVGGTNAHVVLEEAPPRRRRPAPSIELLLLSAKTEALERITAESGEAICGHQEHTLADVAYTLQVGASGLCASAGRGVRDRAEAAADWSRWTGRGCGRPTRPGATAGVALLLRGVGDQYPGMTQEALPRGAGFRAAVDAVL